MSKVLVIGAGASGLMAAGAAAQNGHEVILIERNEKPGRKLMITGKGRCNVTNNCNSLEELIAAVPVNGKFLYSAFSNFMPSNTIEFFETQGVKLKTERGGRVFPESDKSYEIVDALKSFALNAGAEIVNARALKLLIENNTVEGVLTEENEKVSADYVIIATGGLSYPSTGSTGDGYELAKEAGHTVNELYPALVPLVCHEGFCSDIMGLTLKNIAISVIDTKTGKTVYKDFGELLFTHFGVTGPVILSASSHMKNMEKGKYEIYIDLKPALTEEQLDTRILRDFGENNNRNFINALNSLLPKSIVPVVVKLCKVPMNTKIHDVTKEQRKALISVLKSMKLTVKAFRPIDEAIITSGGVNVMEIDPKTMKSKIIKNLSFAGEVIDCNAYTGGYNLQIAFSTGKLAGENI